MATSFGLPLPRAIQENILARLPVMWLGASRRVCKLWKHITGTARFRKMWDMERSCRGEFFMVPFIATGQYVAALDVNVIQFPLGLLPFKREFLAKTEDPIDGQRLIDSSGGLLLFYSKDDEFTVVNPILGKRKVLPKPEFGGVAPFIGMVHHGDSYRVLVAGLVDSDDVQGVVYKQKIIGYSETVDYYETYVGIYDSTTDAWRYHRSKKPKLTPMWYSPVHRKLFRKGIFYCICSPSHALCFDMEHMVWKPELNLKSPKGTYIRGLSEYKGNILALVQSSTDCIQNWKLRSEQEINFMVVNEETNQFELVHKLPKDLIPEDAAVMDMWGWKNKFMFHLVKSQEAGGPFGNPYAARVTFLVYDIDTKVATWPLANDELPFPMMLVEEYITAPRVTFEPSIFALP